MGRHRVSHATWLRGRQPSKARPQGVACRRVSALPLNSAPLLAPHPSMWLPRPRGQINALKDEVAAKDAALKGVLGDKVGGQVLRMREEQGEPRKWG